MSKTLLEISNLSKSFGENTVLKDINLEIKEGEIVGLVGENGAGKSTLMKIIFGMPVIKETGGYNGKIKLEGKEINFNSPFDALEAGIGMVHQEFSLIPGFSAGENIVLNRESTRQSFLELLFGERIKVLDKNEIKKRAEIAIENLGITINSDEYIQEMPVAHMQFTEIAREIEREKIKLLVLDEPTAVLTEGEAEVLVKTIKLLAKKGISIIFITHRLNEIIEACDKVVVLRDGVMINSVATKDTNVDEITNWMIGRNIEDKQSEKIQEEHLKVDDSEVILNIENLSVDMPGELVKKLNLKVREGEILGLAGMAGQGKIGVANGVMGLYYSTGKVTFENQDIKLNDPTDALSKGIFFVSEDRKGVGLLLDKSIEMNIAYPAIQIKELFLKKKFGCLRCIDKEEIEKNAKKYVEQLEIKCMSSKQRVQELSGGNQQKVCLAKAFTMDPKLMFVSEPTRGIDVGAKKLVLDILKKYNKEKKTTIIITSSEVEELRSICDRIAVINEGKVAGILSPKANIIEFGKYMTGIGGSN
ncbi:MULTISPECIES: sugar ABC transporter ATP-binding protein [Fusobacterium]|uniref:sugar ABC transporter ATP-binding protein n=1 Tax=Fusobacterium TaxID=848 RepID=UPI001477473B|nr:MULTISPECIES: sugar ABC transporter ATP-binding protein [Fusobacterium]NME36423.1 sugar ABC transporter ATP-binding protein [Fusobacterium sp. FSA-380-WT-3A]